MYLQDLFQRLQEGPESGHNHPLVQRHKSLFVLQLDWVMTFQVQLQKDEK